MAGRRARPGPRDLRGGAAVRVAEEIRIKAAELLLRELRDPRLAGVHLTRAEVTRDLSRASLYFRTMPGGASREQAEAAARSAASFLRHELGRSLRLRATPEIVLRYDELPDAGARIEELLGSVRPSAGDEAAPSDDEE